MSNNSLGGALCRSVSDESDATSITTAVRIVVLPLSCLCKILMVAPFSCCHTPPPRCVRLQISTMTLWRPRVGLVLAELKRELIYQMDPIPSQAISCKPWVQLSIADHGPLSGPSVPSGTYFAY